MAEQNENRRPADPMEVWEQWYEAASKSWSKAVRGNGNPPSNPFNFYQTWLEGVADVQEQFKSSPANLQELWTRWFEMAADAWKKAAEMGSEPLRLSMQWVEMMDEARARLLEGIRVPADSFTFFKQWFDATNETWSRLSGDVIGTEQFMEISSEFLKSYASFYGVMRRANEEYLRNLQLPTRSDIARVAGLVVNLDEKVDHMDDALEDFEDGAQSNLSQLPLVVQKLASVERLEQRVESLEKRLDRMEGKLDAVLAAFEKLAAMETLAPTKAGDAATSRARRPTAEPRQGSSAKAQVGSATPQKIEQSRKGE